MPAGNAVAADCKLSYRDCETIERALETNSMGERRDRDSLATLPPYKREQKVIELKYQRLKRLSRNLPVCVGNEMSRMILCDASRRLAAANGSVAEPSECSREPEPACLRRR